jgi:hypothetical protein
MTVTASTLKRCCARGVATWNKSWKAEARVLYRHLGTSRLGPTLHRLFPNPFKCLRYSILFCKIIESLRWSHPAPPDGSSGMRCWVATSFGGRSVVCSLWHILSAYYLTAFSTYAEGHSRVHTSLSDSISGLLLEFGSKEGVEVLVSSTLPVCMCKGMRLNRHSVCRRSTKVLPMPPDQPPNDVATRHRMPDEPSGGTGWLHRKLSNICLFRSRYSSASR